MKIENFEPEIIEQFSENLENLARSGKIPRYVVCGVDLYRSRDCAREDMLLLMNQNHLEISFLVAATIKS